MAHGAGDWVTKIGADGLQAIGVRSLGLGIVVRVASGAVWPTHIAAVEALHQIGLLDDPSRTPMASAFRPVLRNAAGEITGRYHPQFSLPRLVS
jgi:L-asparaginase II